MSDSDRGAYAPNEGPLAFDARRPVRGGGGPPPMTLIISGLILVVLVGAIAFFYRSGLRAENGAPRPVGTAVGDIKAPPPAAAQPADPGQGLQIYHAEENGGQAGAAPTFTAGPEQPQARPEPQQVAVAPPQPTAVAAAPLRPAQPAAVAPVATPAPPAPKPVVAAVAVATPAAPKPAPVAAGGSVVQIGAFSSQALADKGWSDAARVAPGAAAGKGKRVEAVDKGGQTLYRTSVTGFSSRAEAEAFCVTLKGAGKNCFVK